MALATVVTVLLLKIPAVQRCAACWATFSLLGAIRKWLCGARPDDDEQNQDGSLQADNSSEDGSRDSSVISEPDSEAEEALLGHPNPPAHAHGRGTSSTPSYWRRLEYSTLFVLFASQFELSNYVLAQLRPCESGYMPANPWIPCSWAGDSPQYVWLQGISYAFAAIYVAGIPGMLSLLLYRNRESIKAESHQTEQRMGFLYETYKPKVYFFEIIWLLRRTLLSLALTLLPADNGFRAAAIALILLGSLFAQQRFRPFLSEAVNLLETISTATLLYSFVVGSQLAHAGDAFRPALQTILWILNALVVGIFFAALMAPPFMTFVRRCCRRGRRAHMLDLTDEKAVHD